MLSSSWGWGRNPSFALEFLNFLSPSSLPPWHSIFEREDQSPRSGSSLADLERRQAERKKEIMKAQATPKMSASQARKAMIEKLEKEGGR